MENEDLLIRYHWAMAKYFIFDCDYEAAKKVLCCI